MDLYLLTQLCCRHKNKTKKQLPDRQTHENWKLFEFSSIPIELSNLVLFLSLLQGK